jgi:hypothetical protein
MELLLKMSIVGQFYTCTFLVEKKMLLSLFVAPLTALSIYFTCETASVPDSVKAELLQRIRSFLMSTSLR